MLMEPTHNVHHKIMDNCNSYTSAIVLEKVTNICKQWFFDNVIHELIAVQVFALGAGDGESFQAQKPGWDTMVLAHEEDCKPANVLRSCE